MIDIASAADDPPMMTTRRKVFLAALAIAALACRDDSSTPSYKAHAAVAGGLSLASTVRTYVSAYYDENGRLPSSNAEARVEGVPLSGPGVSGVAIGPKGVVVATLTGEASIEGKTLELAPAPVSDGGSLTWSCKGGTLPAEYRPSPCR